MVEMHEYKHFKIISHFFYQIISLFVLLYHQKHCFPSIEFNLGPITGDVMNIVTLSTKTLNHNKPGIYI